MATDARWFVEALGAELAFALESSGTRVAMLRIGTGGPVLVLTDHLPHAPYARASLRPKRFVTRFAASAARSGS